MINENIKGKNINNFDDQEEVQNELRQNISSENRQSENYLELRNDIINPMMSTIDQLKEAIIQANQKIDVLTKENDEFKISQVEELKKLTIKDEMIDSNRQELSRLLNKKTSLETEDENNKKIIKELNYKIIELNQKIESIETLNKISQKINKEKPGNIEQVFLIQINELNNKINEISVKNTKLEFDNKNLLNKIEIINKNNKNELEILEALYRKKYEILEKSIERLNDIINELLNEKQRKQINIINYEVFQNDIYKHFAEFEEKIRKFKEQNSQIKQENSKLKNENEELNIIINGKETIIEKLQSNINKIENDFKQRISEININSPNLVNHINNEMVNNNENNENIEQILNEHKKLLEENEILRNNYEQMTQGINEANELFVSKQKEYESTISAQVEKLKEYKFKISILKIKVNELHSEIAFLQEKQIQSPINIYRQENLLSTVEKERNSIDFNFTPEQMKLVGADKTPNINPKIEVNNNNDENENINTNENK